MRTIATSVIATTCLALIAPGVRGQVQPHGGMLRFPDVSQSEIVFVYANDLWTVPREGGQAAPLASPPGAERFPRFSPDGQTIAFVGNYDGGVDLYTIPLAGGVPTRVTHHPARETLSGWTSDGQLIFNSNGMAGLARQQQVFTVDQDGGLPQRLPVPYGSAAAINDDGTWLAYTPFNRDGRTWKRYRGGLASDIWLFNLRDHSARRITDWEGTDTMPMWHGDVVYYLSDNGPEVKLNIWAYNTRTNRHTQITAFSDYDVKWPSIGPGPDREGEIVFQHGSKLKLLDLTRGTVKEVKVTIPGDQPTIRPRIVDVSKMIQGAGISSTGKRAVVQARGDLYSVPAEKGVTRNLTASDGAFERAGAWSPDGRWIACFSDRSGEYELYISQSDGVGERRQLTHDSQTFYYHPIWSPDSKQIFFTDKAGKKYLVAIESGEVKEIDRDPWFNNTEASWSHDSRWLAYSKNPEDPSPSAIWLYNVESGEKHQVTSGMFADGFPAFDRKGDYLYFVSARSFAPTYSDIDTTFIYDDSQVILAVSLRDDIESPFAPESDEEDFKTDSEEEDAAEGDEGDAEDDNDNDDDQEGDDEGDGDEAPPVEDDGISGTWTCTITGEMVPPGGMQFTMILTLNDDNSVTGSISSPMGAASLTGTYDPVTGAFTATVAPDDGSVVTLTGTIKDGTLTATVAGEDFVGEMTGERTAAEGAGGDEDESADTEKPREVVEIDLEGFERRAMTLPITPGSFGRTAVNDKNQLVYVRMSARGAAEGESIKLFDLNADTKTEKEVAAGAGDFSMSSDGKKILIARGSSLTIQPASAGGSGKNLDLAMLKTTINPRDEWRQILTDAWRIERDFFYDPNLHGVDWRATFKRYEAMLEDAVNREDVAFIVGEMISELNVGHAYYFGGDLESSPSESVGMLGVDFEIDSGVYRIARIIEGADWDADARGPLSRSGVDVNEGDYLLAVNGVVLDTSQNPWAPFVGTVGRVIELTVSEKPEIDDDARKVLVKPLANESNLRFRAWIERNRTYVEEKTDGKVGYVYVPDTGLNGQTNLVRQFFGQISKQAMIIDERWNGGGQIPTRFIEILNRPAVNYWARRDMNDWPWPPDAHQGPKCMLINGPSGSGGDAFPYYFRKAGLGKLIGRRTWGGLVGMSGQPGLMDNAAVTVPTFGFYEMDGTWGIEGHGVDPDIDVIDDPSKMVDGGDPQLDAAIEVMLDELKRHPFVRPQRPRYPNRSGMGIREVDK